MLTLKSLKYTEYKGEDREWSIEEFELFPINLLVGKNAVGKTRTLTLINSFADLLSGRTREVFASGEYNAIFKDRSETFEYKLIINEKKVSQEKLLINNKIYLDRGQGGIGKIYAEDNKGLIRFQSPENELASISRRDSIQHPYFENLNDWGSSTFLYKFGGDLGQHHLMLVNPNSNEAPSPDFKATEKVATILDLAIQSHGDNFKNSIIEKLKLVGYEIEDLKVAPLTDFFEIKGPAGAIGPVEGIWIKERDISSWVPQMHISQGMFRVLSLVIQLEYCRQQIEPSLILIDDIGEGLDFDRSMSLVKLLVSEGKSSPIQIIMATNDRFVMNNVPLEYWSIIQRTGSKCKVFNHINSKDKFDEFKFTGLSNFDFLAYDFISQVEEKQ